MKRLLYCFLIMVFSGCITIVPSDISPTINTFDATPSSISPGEPSTLKCDVAGAAKVSIDHNVGDVA